jgi:two-component system chemotaxis response regulator CheY
MPDPTMKILVVDDFATMRRIIKNTLQQLGYTNIEEAQNGYQAMSAIRKGGVQFVISDWNMPVMDGLELVTKIRSEPTLKNLPILMVTAEAERDKVIAAVKAGVNNYIVKPFTPETLKEKIEKIFGA